MVQGQLVDYITSQLKAGLSRDTIKASLVGAGWQAADVDDTMKQIEAGTAKPATSVSVATTGSSSASPMGAPASAGAAKPTSSGPQAVKVSDLVSATDFSTSSSTAASSSPASSFPSGAKGPSMMGTGMASSSSVSKPSSGPQQDKSSKSMFSSGSKPSAGSAAGLEYPPKTAKKHGALLTEVVLGIVIIVAGGFAAFFYAQDASLAGKVSSLTSSSASLTAQLGAVQQQVNASTSALAAEVASETAANQELMADLSFYIVPPGAPATSSATLMGTVASGAKGYVITDQYGAKASVANSKSTTVAAALAPLAASSTPATFEGTYAPGTDSITLTSVNGTAVQ